VQQVLELEERRNSSQSNNNLNQNQRAVLAIMTSLTLKQRTYVFMPVGILIFALATIVSSYFVAFADGTMDFLDGRIKTPPISMLMFAGTAMRIGQVGFPVVSLLAYACLPEFFQGIQQMVGPQTFPKLLYLLRISIMVAFANLAVVGILPLQHDLPQVWKRQKVPISWQSIIHQSAAGFFFMFGIGTWAFGYTLLENVRRRCHFTTEIRQNHLPSRPCAFYSAFSLCRVPF